jgi:hypothetical protein
MSVSYKQQIVTPSLRTMADPASREAAAKIAPRSLILAEKVLAEVRATGLKGLTPDECCALLHEATTSIRPRFRELELAGRISKTGERRKNRLGIGTNVFTSTRR